MKNEKKENKKNPLLEKELMRSIVKSIEMKGEMCKELYGLHQKITTLENLKQEKETKVLIRDAKVLSMKLMFFNFKEENLLGYIAHETKGKYLEN